VTDISRLGHRPSGADDEHGGIDETDLRARKFAKFESDTFEAVSAANSKPHAHSTIEFVFSSEANPVSCILEQNPTTTLVISALAISV
jgi:hypothetical protein